MEVFSFVFWWLHDFVRNVFICLLGFPIAIVVMAVRYSEQGREAFVLLNTYKSLSVIPLFGSQLVSKFIQFINPYGGSIGAHIEQLNISTVRVCMPDRPWFVANVRAHWIQISQASQSISLYSRRSIHQSC